MDCIDVDYLFYSFNGQVRHTPISAFKPVSAPSPDSDTVTSPSSDATQATVPASCNSTITPACLQALYNIPTTPASSGTQSTLGVAAFDEQNANLVCQSDCSTAVRGLTERWTTGGPEAILDDVQAGYELVDCVYVHFCRQCDERPDVEGCGC